jgi:hypothetical protein
MPDRDNVVPMISRTPPLPLPAACRDFRVMVNPTRKRVIEIADADPGVLVLVFAAGPVERLPDLAGLDRRNVVAPIHLGERPIKRQREMILAVIRSLVNHG